MLLEQLVNGLTLGGVYALIALGFTLIFGVLKLMHIAHGDVFMFTGYLVMTLIGIYAHLPFPVLLAAGIAVAAVLGLLTERLAFRPYRQAHEIVPLISGIGVSLILQNAAILLWGPEQHTLAIDWKPADLVIGGLRISGQRIWILGITLGLMLVFNYWILRTRTGRALRATASDPQTAQLMGIPTERMIMLTFVVGSAFAGAASVLVGALYGAIFPSLGFSVGLKAFAATLMGGLGSLSGAVAGGVALGVLEVLTAGFLNVAYQDLVEMTVLILVLLLRPNGLLGKRVEEKL
ncbi:branched-chain amino acid ABC transporter permease [Paenibacillus puerhi]|uniref:branched-chain amino acid ABC transporter permease n=1 Tax=Paenibacillus puerhi TaxID=2692622 RepID=UPI001356D6A5|nr:branched-chain amino acid ABC transporter permease [Paenibacillus puerhi]